MSFDSGSQYINQMTPLSADETPAHLSPHTGDIIAEERRWHAEGVELHGKAKWADIVRRKVLKTSKRQAWSSYHVASNEHMSHVDCVDGTLLRGGRARREEEEKRMLSQLVLVHPHIDGRLQDVGRS